ncbi:MAG: methionyl-tRNA formyltransferase [Saprospirales bacterium]|nr:MAG: methionyl-tRNA formyltransferase [Saprospirales bacterium]
MRIVFFGTSSFAVPSLRAIEESEFDLAAVVTSVDKRGGRGRKELITSPVKEFAFSKRKKIFQPVNLKSTDFQQQLKDIGADIFVVVAFRMLPESVWNMPDLGTVNLHASLLPKFRGAAPIHHAIISGEEKTGLTVFQLKQQIDTGDIILQEEVPIQPEETTGHLHDRMAILGGELLLKALRLIRKGEVNYLPQSDEKATTAPKIFKETGELNFREEVLKNYNLIRGLNPFPGAYTRMSGKTLKIWSAGLEALENENARQPGKIISDGKNFLKIVAKDGLISCKEVQLQGKKRMSIKEFLNGWGDSLPEYVDN